MSDTKARFQLWSSHPYFDKQTQAELKEIPEGTPEWEDRFYKELEFGTGGLRGVIGAGTNRINRYVVRLITKGLADYIAEFGPKAMDGGVVIAHDSRRYSAEFALEASAVLNAMGIRSYQWKSLRPTPMLSFAVRRLKATAGIVITASHNPPEYNGYKVYWSDGGQMPPERTEEVLTRIRAITDITGIETMPDQDAREENLWITIHAGVDKAYYDHLKQLIRNPELDRTSTKILYTPLHGSGNVPVQTILKDLGFAVSVVPEQEQPDPDFPTVAYPNPEEAAVFALALRQAEREHPDVILATDPDADRLGAMALDASGSYRLLTGNQIGALLVDFVIKQRQAAGDLPANSVVLKSIATSNMIAPICASNGVQLVDTHTGFKFIGDKIREYEESGSHSFLFGFEESYGYLGASFVRDKDAVMSAMLLAEAAAYHKAQGRTLYEALERIWATCGHFLEGIHTVTLKGKEGVDRMAEIMADLRANPVTFFGPESVQFADDYLSQTSLEIATGGQTALQLGAANVLHYRFANGGFVMVRPSGTEPKLKIYFSVCGPDLEQAHVLLDGVRAAALDRLGLG